MNNETLFDKAKQNLKVAESIYSTIAINDEAYLNYVGYHIQQALELSIKYMLEMNGVNYPKTRDIDQLIRLANINNVNLYLNEYIDDHSEMFSLWEARTRYILNYRLERRKIERSLTETKSYLDVIDKMINCHMENNEGLEM
ncbi:hypothetical protein B5E87_07185 [Massilimicrobiota sp. An142]|uniref:HEPN domain-containing protein n=1 Tax=Massilimicrobiota sp. An142 TaxID=1965564 RepID=UPI000B365D98|nr:HEPN domain-containing protein [Massilimicrobiota sp. An142]OUQ13166.1 hypothetical protein B5E87_07185 [Massilimicrobiota sp. An142]